MNTMLHGIWNEPSKIAIGIDIGTTQSGVSFAFLQEDGEKKFHRVTHWPGQESQNQQGKIPTIVWYEDNKPMFFGAEALSPHVEEEAEDKGWTLAKYFKLHLHPADLAAKHELKLEPLPSNVSLAQIYADFLKYLLKHTQPYFEDHILDGKTIWETYKSTMAVIIAHPNGWGIKEQAFLRSAAVTAGFSSHKEAGTRVRFVSEAEASVHFCIFHTNLINQLEPGTSFAVCDAGGSTVDTTVYSVDSTSPLRLGEVRASGCVQAGAIFIDGEAERYLDRTLRSVGLSDEEVKEYVSHGVKDFESNAKRAFRDVNVDPSPSIEVAGVRFKNPAIHTRRGRMSVPGSTIKRFFDPCLDQILSSVDSQLESTSASFIVLVGGFGESLFLREQLKARFEPMGCQVTTTSQGTSKAVADGAVIWFASNTVGKRAPRFSYGIEVVVRHKPHDEAHRRRPIVSWPSGQYSRGGWSQIVTKDIPLDCEVVTRRPYHREYSSANPQLDKFTEVIWKHTLLGLPEWIKFKTGSPMPGFDQACSVRANLSDLRHVLSPQRTPNGEQYWSLRFNVCIHFGRTELQAFLEWVEDGVPCIGPAEILSPADLS